MRGWFFMLLANHCPKFKFFDNRKYLLLRLAGMQIRFPCLIYGPVFVRPICNTKKICIGKNSFLNSEIRFECLDEIIIGNDCQIGPRVSFETVSHGLQFEAEKGRGTKAKKIIVEDEVWIGSGAIILQGITIGKGAVIAAGAVVTSDVPSKTLFGGVPAKLIKTLF